jgi:hypothetical protein
MAIGHPSTPILHALHLLPTPPPPLISRERGGYGGGSRGGGYGGGRWETREEKDPFAER